MAALRNPLRDAPNIEVRIGQKHKNKANPIAGA